MRRALRAFAAGPESEGGQAIVLLAILMAAMLMMVGLALDVGQLYSSRRTMQEAADAAAYAASVTLYQSGTQAQAFAAARADGTSNGFTDNVDGASVTVRQPLTAPYNTASFVEVLITKSIRTTLAGGGSQSTSVTVGSISGAEPLNNKYALIALDTGATNNALVIGSGATVNITGGGILVNSTSPTAASSSTSSWSISCPSTAPCEIDVAGTATGTWPAANPPAYFNGAFSGKPQQPDPFAGYPKPSTAGLLTDRAGFGPSLKTLGSGIYTTKVQNQANLCHGIYIIKAGMGPVGTDLTSTDPVTGATCDGKVLIFNTTQNYPSAGGSCNAILWNGNNTVELDAMSTGTYAGMLVYQDPVCTDTMIVGGGGGFETNKGTIYLPNAAFQGSGGAQVQGGQIVAKTISLSIEVEINFNASTTAQPTLPRLAH